MGVLSDLLVPLGPWQGELAKLSTPVLIAVGTLTFVVVSVVLNVLSQLLLKDKNKPPLVFHFFPFLGSTVIYGMDPYAFFWSCQKKYGDVFTFILLGRRMTVCLGPQGNDFVFNGKLADVSAEEAYTHLTTPVFGEGVVYDCPNHRLMEQKKFMKFGLTVETFKSYTPLIVEQVQDYIKKSKFFKGAKGSVPLCEIIPEVTIFTASRSLQGKEVREGLDGSFANLYHDLDLGFNPMNFLFPWFPFPGNKRRDAAQRKMARFYMDIIERRRKNPESAPKEQDMLWNLMDRSYKDGTPISDKEVAHMMIALLMAGQHTSMATTTWVLLHLAEKPQIVQELYEEQQAICGRDPRPLAYEDLAKMPLLNNVIREVLRMHPPIHSIFRKVKSPMTVKDKNYIIPPGYYVLALTIHTRTTKMPFETKATIKTFGGHLLKLSHPSSTTGTPMAVNLFLPPQSTTQKVPVLFYLSGLTCTPDNCSEKGFLQRHASLHGLAIVYPDTSPRGANIAGEDDSWDFGTGAGFYVDATREPWKQHYRMESYITRELPAALWEAFPEKLDKERVSITGHSMGGHGALTLFLKHPGLYKSVSAFAPIANPINCPWGQKAFGGYLGEDREEWKKHDATELLKAWKGGKFQALVDVGTGDNFYKQGQLLPENLEAAAKEVGAEVEVRYQPEYDHSYYFISTFGEDHVAYHAKFLGK